MPNNPVGSYTTLIGAALLSTVAAYPIFVALPLVTFGLVVLARVFSVRPGVLKGARMREALVVLAVFVGLMIVAALVLAASWHIGTAGRRDFDDGRCRTGRRNESIP